MNSLPSAVDHSPDLALGVGGGPEPPPGQLAGDAPEDLAVGQPLALQGEVPPADELLGQLVEIGQHLFDEMLGLGPAQPPRPHEISDKVLKLAPIRHGRGISKWMRIMAKIMPDFGQDKSVISLPPCGGGSRRGAAGKRGAGQQCTGVTPHPDLPPQGGKEKRAPSSPKNQRSTRSSRSSPARSAPMLWRSMAMVLMTAKTARPT